METKEIFYIALKRESLNNTNTVVINISKVPYNTSDYQLVVRILNKVVEPDTNYPDYVEEFLEEEDGVLVYEDDMDRCLYLGISQDAVMDVFTMYNTQVVKL